MIRILLTPRMARALAELDVEGLDPEALKLAGESNRSTELALDPDEALRVMVAASFAVLGKHPEATTLDAAAQRIEEGVRGIE